ncbi:MAG: HNH endonuclease [Hyphomonadaceae bacterium]
MADLKKVRASLLRFSQKCAEIDERNREIDARNDESERRKAQAEALQDAWITEHIGPIATELRQLNRELKASVGRGLSSLFEPKFSFSYREIAGEVEPRPHVLHRRMDGLDKVCFGWDEWPREITVCEFPGRNIAARYSAAYERLVCVRGSCPKVEAGEKAPRQSRPGSVVSFVIGGARVKVDLEEIDDAQVAACILIRTNELESSKEDLRKMRARVADNEFEVRAQARAFKAEFDDQQRQVCGCPYCGKQLISEDAELDHIYPVSKGGRSFRANLVFVCGSCNQKKSNLTLRNFIELHCLDENMIHKALRTLQKDF